MSSRPAFDFPEVKSRGFFSARLASADPAVAEAIADGRADKGVSLCGSGVGISISVNRHPACRCALVSESLSARLAREHNDANVIALGARLIGIEQAKECVSVFLATPFAGGRHQRRVDKLSSPVFEAEEPA